MLNPPLLGKVEAGGFVLRKLATSEKSVIETTLDSWISRCLGQSSSLFSISLPSHGLQAEARDKGGDREKVLSNSAG